MNELQGLSKEALVDKYSGLIRSIANQLRSRLRITLEIDDLISYGRIGLLEAAERFDYKVGVSFKTFAYYRIRGAMYDGLRTMEVITRRKDPRMKFEQAATQFLGNEMSRSPAPRKPTVTEEIEEFQNMVASLVPLYFLASDALDQVHADEKAGSADAHASFQQEKVALHQAMEQLSENERALIQHYYYKDMTLEEAASKLGLSKSWASRLHARALSKLKDLLKRLRKEQ